MIKNEHHDNLSLGRLLQWHDLLAPPSLIAVTGARTGYQNVPAPFPATSLSLHRPAADCYSLVAKFPPFAAGFFILNKLFIE